ncbi:hypothetical protein KSF_005220 [Reticulibacter mediterranei]|uniref:Uncharacterized protein n=1 Tax=Reticulibacter mediterranei TaxID=2778369 RepID=A0A8J3MX19_9CHLR|nr:hypothetical protein [Reticulibacter mediterranei]GHO90474.1 hypothetical protein KSF_005220 [Reticulibacter mediterranei]
MMPSEGWPLPSLGIITTKRKIGLEAADYFQRQGDWIAFSKDATRAILRQIYPNEDSPERLFLEALFEDNPQKVENIAHNLSQVCLWEMLLLYNEHGILSLSFPFHRKIGTTYMETLLNGFWRSTKRRRMEITPD